MYRVTWNIAGEPRRTQAARSFISHGSAVVAEAELDSARARIRSRARFGDTVEIRVTAL